MSPLRPTDRNEPTSRPSHASRPSFSTTLRRRTERKRRPTTESNSPGLRRGRSQTLGSDTRTLRAGVGRSDASKSTQQARACNRLNFERRYPKREMPKGERGRALVRLDKNPLTAKASSSIHFNKSPAQNRV